MQTVVVASRNPVKARAVEDGFAAVFPGRQLCFERLAVASGVGAQPASDAETWRGARQRAAAAAERAPHGDFWVGIEGGVEDGPDGMMAFAWIAIASRERWGRGRTGSFPLPEAVAARVRDGEELGVADDHVFGRRNSKRGDGAVGLLTGNLVDRRQLYAQAVILALIPFTNQELFPPAPPPAGGGATALV